MPLVVEDQITLSTQFGSSQVQLLVGDITDLPVEEKVDIVFTSAFPGDYATVKGTLIHALNKKLGINVRQLARDKEMDLTRMFSCWVSKPLPPDKPYRRLVCFEVPGYQRPTEQISMMFRATMPIFNDTENTIITPALATGCQGADLEQMVGVMVNTACNWIKAGLPLKCLKLVLFARDIERAKSFQYTRELNLFASLKKKWESKENKVNISRSLDVTVCFHDQDKNQVKKICDFVLQENKSLKIYDETLKRNEKDSWQDKAFEILSNSTKIVILLTPQFVSDKWCLEQFNLAMLCNTSKGYDVIAPFYMQTVESFPAYMTVVQYQDCRENKTGTFEGKLSTACKDLIQNVKSFKATTESEKKTEEEMKSLKPAPIYDVFISYCHQTSEMARAAVEALSANYPDIKVFFDMSELKTGNLWQQALYEAVDQTRCMVAMLSDAYLKSSVCQEEYHIALARHIEMDDFMLVPVCLPELSKVPKSFTNSKPVLVSSADDVKKLIDKIVPGVQELKKLNTRKEKEITRVEQILIHERFLKFSQEFQFDWDMKVVKSVTPSTDDSTILEGNISFIYTANGVKFAAILSEMLRHEMPLVNVSILQTNQVEARNEIDNADMIVIFVSDEFLRSKPRVEELHIALCRQRSIKDRTVIYLVEIDPIQEGFYYPNILPVRVSFFDQMWSKFSSAFDFKVKRVNVNAAGMEGTYMCSSSELVAIQMITADIVKLLSRRGQGSDIPTNVVNALKIEETNKGCQDELKLPKEVAVTVEAYEPSKPREEDQDDDEDDEEEDEEGEEKAKEIKEGNETSHRKESLDMADGENTKHIERAREVMKAEESVKSFMVEKPKMKKSESCQLL